MPCKLLSNCVKKHKANKANEVCLHQAAEAYLAAKNGPGKLHEGLFEQEERKKALAAEKRSKADGRAAKKEAQVKLEEEWKRIKIIHEEVTMIWKVDCDRLASEGVPKKNLLK